jgi:hypothetical protein
VETEPTADATPAATAAANPLLVSHFWRLASVEAQSVLQLLDNRSRLAAAATCRRMLAEALQPFSWKYGELQTVTPAQLATLDRELNSSSLLLLAPIRLQYAFEDPQIPAAFHRIRNLVSLDAPKQVSAALPFLQHAASRRLRQLRLPICTLDAAPVDLTGAHLSQLTSCEILREVPGDGMAVPILAQLDPTVLVDLVIDGRWSDVRTQLREQLARFPTIRRLVVPDSVFDGHDFRFDTFCSSVHRLHSLTLRHDNESAKQARAQAVQPAHAFVILQFPQALTALAGLRTLRISGFEAHYHAVLAHLRLPAAKRLTHLCLNSIFRVAADVPSVAAFTTLQTAMPQLHIVYSIPVAKVPIPEALAQVDRLTLNPLRCIRCQAEKLDLWLEDRRTADDDGEPSD